MFGSGRSIPFCVRYTKLNKNKDMAKKTYKYKPQYGVIVICENEQKQKKVFEELKKKGYKLKIVNV